MKYLVLDGDGTLGHVVSGYLSEHGNSVSEFNASISDFAMNGSNIPALFHLQEILQKNTFDAIANCYAITNKHAEDDKTTSLIVNTLLPYWLVEVVQDQNTIVVNRGTDCIYSGSKGSYGVASIPDGISFYARTKALGEVSGCQSIVLRTSIIGPEKDPNGEGLFNWFMRQENSASGYANAIWTGITSIEFAKLVDYSVRNELNGVYNASISPISKLTLLTKFNSVFRNNTVLITSVQNVRNDKSLVPSAIGTYQIPSYDIMLDEMKQWILKHSDSYPHYIQKMQ